MDDSNNWLLDIIRLKFDKTGITKEWSYVNPKFLYFNHNSNPSRILPNTDIIQNSTKISEYFRNSNFSSIIDDLFENISRIGIVFIVLGAIWFFVILAMCWYCYWVKFLRPYHQYKKVATEYDELLSDVFAHDNLTDYEGDSSDGSIDSHDQLNNGGTTIEMRSMPFASKDVRLSLSEING